jgi:D-alanyl-D-alanine carboxypeptidase
LVAKARQKTQLVLWALIILSHTLAGCQEAAVVVSATSTPIATAQLTAFMATPSPGTTRLMTSQQPPLPTPVHTSTRPPEATATPSPSPTPTATPIGLCSERMPANGLTTLVTAEYGLSRDYVPPSLISISNYLPLTVTLGYPTQVRAIVAEPLVEMINDMHSAGLKPTVISGYRSYDAQAIAWAKWQEKHPDRASIISAPPGHSEHQLGTTIDFGSPELSTLVGDDEIEFHTNFYLTGEGKWLSEHAHEYGFVLSYPRETFELTGMYYEPWHYRYVGQEMAILLKDRGISLISYLTSDQPPPCIP